MKKMIFSAVAFAVVAVSAVAVAPTTSEAIPAFARQTGAACLSCHFQSFPTLSAFGRAFKQGAFTDMGEQALIEDDDLSLPVVLNLSLIARPQFVNVATSGPGAPAGAGTVKTTAITADQVLLFGTRIGTNSGAFIEYDGTFANYQQINSWDLGDMKAGFSIFNTGFGETAGMEVASTYGQHGGMLEGKAVSANNQLANNVGGIGGVTAFVANDFVTASVSVITASAVLDGAVPNGWKLAPSVRVYTYTDVGAFEVGAGVVFTSGNTVNAATIAALNAPGLAAVPPVIAISQGTLEMDKWGVDFQAQGELADMQVGIYADYASAAASTAGTLNLFNPGQAGDLNGYSVRANIKPLHNVILGAAYGSLSDDGGVNGTDHTQWQVAALYELYQNFTISLIYQNNENNITNVTTKTTILDIEAAI